jgi:hypothetical protein
MASIIEIGFCLRCVHDSNSFMCLCVARLQALALGLRRYAPIPTGTLPPAKLARSEAARLSARLNEFLRRADALASRMQPQPRNGNGKAGVTAGAVTQWPVAHGGGQGRGRSRSRSVSPSSSRRDRARDGDRDRDRDRDEKPPQPVRAKDRVGPGAYPRGWQVCLVHVWRDLRFQPTWSF